MLLRDEDVDASRDDVQGVCQGDAVKPRQRESRCELETGGLVIEEVGGAGTAEHEYEAIDMGGADRGKRGRHGRKRLRLPGRSPRTGNWF